MRKRISLLFVALMLALTMSFGAAGAAFAYGHHTGCTKDGPIVSCPGEKNNWTTQQKGSSNSSHPQANVNPGGNQPPGQNR